MKNNVSKEADKYKLDLSTLYLNKGEFLKDYKIVEQEIDSLLNYKNQIMNSKEDLYNGLNAIYSAQKKLEKLLTYAEVNSDIDLSSSTYRELKDLVYQLQAKYRSNSSILTNEINSNLEKLEKYRTDKLFIDFEQSIYDIVRLKNHIPKAELLEMESVLKVAIEKTSDTYKSLKNVEMKYNTLEIDGNKVIINFSNFVKFRGNQTREIRKKVYETYYSSFKDLNKTFANNYSLRVFLANKLANLKKYSSVLEQKIVESDLPMELFDNLIKGVEDKIYLKEKYNNILKKQLKLSELHDYDMSYNPITFDKEYSYNNSIERILDCFNVYGEEYINKAKKIINENCIDVYPAANKVSGGYNFRNYEKPVIVYNYYNKIEDMFGICHEIGHAVNAMMVKESNPFPQFHYSNILSELSSLTNEILLANDIYLKSNDKEEKLVALKRIIDLFLVNVYEAIKRAEIERDVHNYVEENSSLNNEKMNEIYMKYHQKYSGSNICLNSDSQYTWPIILHFYLGYYNFQYAVGLLSATKIVNDILKNPETGLKRYMEFLSTGGSKTVIEAYQVVGIDLTSKEFIDDAFEYFEEIINKYEKLCLEN